MLTCAVRPSVILGPHSRLCPGDYQLVPQIHACIDKFETPFIIGSGENLYDFTFVTNVADAHVLAAENLLSTGTAAGEAFFISNQEPVPFRDFMLAIWREFGHVPPFEVKIPESLAWLAGLIAEMATWVTGTSALATLSRGSVQDATGTRYASGEKARQILGYYPQVGLQEGIRIACSVSSDNTPNRPAIYKTNFVGLPRTFGKEKLIFALNFWSRPKCKIMFGI